MLARLATTTMIVLATSCTARAHSWAVTDVAHTSQERLVVPPATRQGNAIALAAAHYLAVKPDGFRSDCSGFVEAVLFRAGLTHMAGSARNIWEASIADGSVHRQLQPTLGDLAFFDNSYDRNHNGLPDDILTHIAVVIDVEDDGTVVMAHNGSSSGRSILRMNLHQPHRARMGDHRLNDRLRWRDPSSPETPTLAGELWRGFATVPHDAVAMGE